MKVVHCEVDLHTAPVHNIMVPLSEHFLTHPPGMHKETEMENTAHITLELQSWGELKVTQSSCYNP